MKKNKITTLALAGVLTLTGFAAIGCGKDPEKPHTHNYVGELCYMVEGEKAYTYKECDCGEKEKTEIPNAIIATPTNAQTILNGDISNKTIVFDGEFSNALEIGPNGTDRTLENITFAATEDSEFENLFVIEAVSTSDYSPLSTSSLTKNGSKLNVNNITFTNMEFEGLNGRLFTHIKYTDEFKNFTVQNCSFEMETRLGLTKEQFHANTNYLHYEAAIGINIGTKLTDSTDNLVVKDCFIDGHFQGVYMSHVNNLTIENNIITNTNHNSIGIQSYTGSDSTAENHYVSGNIIIRNNNLSNTHGYNGEGERAIRFGNLKNATVTITGNTFTKTYDSDNEVIKSEEKIIGDNTFNIEEIIASNTFDSVVESTGTAPRLIIAKKLESAE